MQKYEVMTHYELHVVVVGGGGGGGNRTFNMPISTEGSGMPTTRPKSGMCGTACVGNGLYTNCLLFCQITKMPWCSISLLSVLWTQVHLSAEQHKVKYIIQDIYLCLVLNILSFFTSLILHQYQNIL